MLEMMRKEKKGKKRGGEEKNSFYRYMDTVQTSFFCICNFSK